MRRFLQFLFIIATVIIFPGRGFSSVPADSLYKRILFSSNGEAIADVLFNFYSHTDSLELPEISATLDKVIIQVFTEGDIKALEEGVFIAIERFRNKNLFDLSILFIQKGAFISRQLNDLSREADYYRRLAGTAWDNGRYYLSLESGYRALIYYEKNPELDARRLSYLYNTIALNYRALGRYSEALQYFQEALEIVERENDEQMMGLILTNMGRLFFMQGDYQKSIDFHYRGIELELISQSYRAVGRSYTSIAETFHFLEENDSALHYINKAIEVQKEVNDLVGMSRTLSLKGFILKKEEKFRAALENYMESISLAESQDALDELRIALKGISRVYAVTGDYAKAFDYYLRYSGIQSKQFDISHLSDLNQLEERLKLEEKEREIQKLLLQRQKNLAWFFIAIAMMALALMVLFFTLYRLKNKSFTELSLQSNTINIQKDELLALNKELIAAKNKAEEADKLKSVFLSNMSHEIRTPMNAIIGFSSLLSDSGISENDRKMFVDIVQNNSKTLLQLIDDIIDFSKIEAGQLNITNREVGIDQLLEEIYLQFYNKMVERNEKELVLSYKKPPNIKDCRILADQPRLNQVLSNLISNAIKFTPSGVVEFGYSIEKEADENYLRFYVRDTGIGISPGKQKVIFERFRQGDEGTTRPFEGTGLGLSIAKGIVERMGGKMWVESIVNQGSTFYFTIPYSPVLKSNIIAEELEEQKMNGPSFAGRKILIAEDEAYNYIFLEKLLKNSGTKVFWAKDGNESVEIVKANPDIDLIFMDIKLPGISGLEATRKIRKFNPGVVIIAQTAYAMDEDRQKCLVAGCNDYISKPIEIPKFYGLLSKYLG
jgi:signal transduction histidine kinase